MGYRVLVDENVDPATAALLRERGHVAVNVEDLLGKGAADSRIAAHARQNDFLVLTNDTDFLRPERRRGITILYCPENTLQAHEFAARVDEVGAMIPDQADLPAVSWLGEARRR